MTLIGYLYLGMLLDGVVTALRRSQELDRRAQALRGWRPMLDVRLCTSARDRISVESPVKIVIGTVIDIAIGSSRLAIRACHTVGVLLRCKT
jgi:hypothetical protein